MADNKNFQGLKDKVSNFANNVKSHVGNMKDGAKQGFNAVKYDKLVSILDSLTAKARDLNSDKFEKLKTCINNLFNNLNTSKIYDLPSKDLDVIIEFAEELDGKFPKNNILVDDYNRLISDLENSADKLTAVVDACRLYVSSITTTKKEDKMDDIVSTCRFIGIDIFKDHDGKYVETKRSADRTVRPPVLADGSEFIPVKSENVLKYLNQEGVFSKIQAHNFLKQFQTQYQKTLSESGLASSEVMKIASKYSVNSSQFKTFVLVDEFSRDNLLKDYLNNELIASGLSETLAQIDGDESLKSYNQMKLMLEDKLTIVTLDSNKVIEQYAERLKVLQNLHSRESDAIKKDVIQKDINSIKEVGYRFVALKEICSKNRDVLLTMTPYAVSKIVDNLTVVLDNSRPYPVRLTLDTSIMAQEDCDKINTTLEGIDFTDFASLKREEGEKKKEEVKEEKVEEQDEEEEIIVPPTSNMQLIRHITYVCSNDNFDSKNLSTLFGVFGSIRKSAIANKIANISSDTKLTISQWEDIIGFDLIKTLAQYDTKGDPDKETFKKELLEAKLKGIKITLLNDQFKADLESLFKLPKPNDPIIQNAFVQLVRLQEYAKSQGKRIEDFDLATINKKLEEFKVDSSKPATDKEKAIANKLNRDADFLDLVMHNGATKDAEAKKRLSELMDKYPDKDQLTKEAQEQPVTSEEYIEQKSKPKYEIQTYAKKFGIPDNESLVKKLKGYNTKYLVKLIDDICKSIKKTKIWTEIKPTQAQTAGGSDPAQANPADNDPKKPDDEKKGENKPKTQEELAKDILEKLIDLLKTNKEQVVDGAVDKSKEQSELEQIKSLFENLSKLCGGDKKLENSVLDSILKGMFSNPFATLPNNGMDAGVYKATCTLLATMSSLYLTQVINSVFKQSGKLDFTSDVDILGLLIEGIDARLEKEKSKRQTNVAEIGKGFDKLIKDIEAKAKENPEKAFELVEVYATRPDKVVQTGFTQTYGFDSTILLSALCIAYPEKYGHVKVDVTDQNKFLAMALSVGIKEKMKEFEQKKEEGVPTKIVENDGFDQVTLDL